METESQFRARSREHFERLLLHYRLIERWIKRGEQINKKALISAMNELRYAARQLFNALRLFDHAPLTEGERSVITKRLTIAEQYFLNAEHDIWDAIVGYYDEVIDGLDLEFGSSVITIYFNEYPLLRKRRTECLKLISDAREFYDRRKEIYDTLRLEHFPYFAAAHERLFEAEAAATAAKSKLETDLARARLAKTRTDRWNVGLTIFGLVVTIGGIVLSVYLWLWAREDFCAVNGARRIIGEICELGPPTKPPSEPQNKPK